LTNKLIKVIEREAIWLEKDNMKNYPTI